MPLFSGGFSCFAFPTRIEIRPPQRGLRLRAILRLVAALSLLLTSLPLSAQNSTAPEYLAKANYLANFPSFVDWPPEVLPSGNAPLLICVFGEFSFGTSLAEMTRARRSMIGVLKFAGYTSHRNCPRATFCSLAARWTG